MAECRTQNAVCRAVHAHQAEDVVHQQLQHIALHLVAQTHRQHRHHHLLRPQRHNGPHLLQNGSAHGRSRHHAAQHLRPRHFTDVLHAAQPFHHSFIVQDHALGCLFLREGKGTLQHIHKGSFIFFVVICGAFAEHQSRRDHRIHIFLCGQLVEPQRHAAHPALDDAQIIQLVLVRRGGQKAVVSVAVVAPLFRHHAGHDVAAGNDVEDIAYIPIRFQSAVCSVVVVVVRLQIRAVRCRQCRRCGKGVNKGIFLRDLRQLLPDARRRQVCHSRAAAVAAQPELDGAQRSRCSLGFFQVVLQILKKMLCCCHKAIVPAAFAHMQVAGPLGTIADTAQHGCNNGGALAILYQCFLRKSTARGIHRGVQAALVARIDRIGKAKLLVGIRNAVLTARFTLHPVKRIALVGVAACRHKAQRCQCQLVAVLQRRVLKKGICIIKIVGEICFAVVAAEGKGVVILRHRTAHHSLCGLRHQSLCRRVRGQHACHGSCCRLAKGTSFYGLHLSAPIKASA